MTWRNQKSDLQLQAQKIPAVTSQVMFDTAYKQNKNSNSPQVFLTKTQPLLLPAEGFLGIHFILVTTKLECFSSKYKCSLQTKCQNTDSTTTDINRSPHSSLRLVMVTPINLNIMVWKLLRVNFVGYYFFFLKKMNIRVIFLVCL